MSNEDPVGQEAMDIGGKVFERGCIGNHGLGDVGEGGDVDGDLLVWVDEGGEAAFFFFSVMEHNSYFCDAVISSVSTGCFYVNDSKHEPIKIRILPTENRGPILPRPPVYASTLFGTWKRFIFKIQCREHFYTPPFGSDFAYACYGTLLRSDHAIFVHVRKRVSPYALRSVPRSTRYSELWASGLSF